MIRDMQRRYLFCGETSDVIHLFSLPRNHSYAEASKDEHNENVLSSVRYITWLWLHFCFMETIKWLLVSLYYRKYLKLLSIALVDLGNAMLSCSEKL
jgi:hypothetical protein